MIKEKLDNLILEATQTEDNMKLKVLRLIKSKYLKFISLNGFNELDDNNEIEILKDMLTSWEEETRFFKAAGKDTTTLEIENKYLETFIPKEILEKERRVIIKDVIESYLKGLPVEKRTSLEYLDNIIKLINNDYVGIDNELITTVYKEVLNL